MTGQPRLPSDVVEARLNHLIDRARRGALLPEEADQFTTELRDLVRRLEDEEDTSRRLLTQRQEMAAERHVWQELGDRYRSAWQSARHRAALYLQSNQKFAASLGNNHAAYLQLAAEITRLSAGQCTHDTAPDLRTRCVAALTAAACDGDCGLTEQACQVTHPITSAIAGGVTHISGPVTGIVDTVLAVLGTKAEAPQATLERCRPTQPVTPKA